MKAFGRYRFPSKWYRQTRFISMRQENYTLRLREIRPKNLSRIPDIQNLWSNYRRLEFSIEKAKNLMLDELIQECNIPRLPLPQTEKMKMVRLEINKLIEHNLVQSHSTVVDGLLSHLEPFPFNRSKVLVNKKELCIKYIKEAIGNHYLAWKFKTTPQNICNISKRLKLPLFEFQSMRSLRKNIDMIEDLPGIYHLKVAEKVYHVQQVPFNLDLVLNFQETLVGVNWESFPEHCPDLLLHSYEYILFLISSLQNMQFTDTQIREGLPFLHQAFFNLLYKLHILLSHPETAKFRNEDKFLHLLFFSKVALGQALDVHNFRFKEMVKFIKLQKDNRRFIRSSGSALNLIREFYEPDPRCRKTLARHKVWKLVTKNQVYYTLTYLQNNGFRDTEVSESITIVFYPSQLIEKSLKKIKQDEKKLAACGFQNGCVPEDTHFFREGTKSKNKLLQLCLYYLEKMHNFSGNGVLAKRYELKRLERTLKFKYS